MILYANIHLYSDIEPSPEARDDRVYMVLWFRESAGKPLYRSVMLFVAVNYFAIFTPQHITSASVFIVLYMCSSLS